MRRTLLAGMIALSAPMVVADTRKETPVFPPGSMTCEQAVAPDRIDHSRAWVNGYLTAFGESLAPPSLWPGDPDTIATLFNETCAAFPKFTLVEAARWVILTLQDRRFNKKK